MIILSKLCPKCKKEKMAKEFWSNKGRKDGLFHSCKECIKKERVKNKEKRQKYQKKYTQEHKDYYDDYYKKNKYKISEYHKMYKEKNKEKIKKYCKEYKTVNKEKLSEKAKEYKATHKEEISEKGKVYFQKNKTRITKRVLDRLKRDPENKTVSLLRTRIRLAVRSQNAKKYTTTMELIGCSPKELRNHLESQFKKGMTWENNTRKGWHIDHIRPCSSYDLTDPEQQKECFNYTNMQPLWWYENMKKSNKWK